MSKDIVIYILCFLLGIALGVLKIYIRDNKLSNKKGSYLPKMPFKKYRAYHPSKDAKKIMERAEQEDMWK